MHAGKSVVWVKPLTCYTQFEQSLLESGFEFGFGLIHTPFQPIVSRHNLAEQEGRIQLAINALEKGGCLRQKLGNYIGRAPLVHTRT
jgi:hypothetical protein